MSCLLYVFDLLIFVLDHNIIRCAQNLEFVAQFFFSLLFRRRRLNNFISLLNYKKRLNSVYLAVSQLTNWQDEELTHHAMNGTSEI